MDIVELDRCGLDAPDLHKYPEEFRYEITSLDELHAQRFIYTKRTGRKFQVLWHGLYGMNCTEPVVAYTNHTPTSDRPAWTKWVLEFDKIQKYFYIVKS